MGAASRRSTEFLESWRGEGSRESSEPLAGPEGAPGELERDWGQGLEGQDPGNGSQCQRAGLDGRLGIGNCSWEGGEGAGMEFPDLLWLPLDPWQCPRPGWRGSEHAVPWQGLYPGSSPGPGSAPEQGQARPDLATSRAWSHLHEPMGAGYANEGGAGWPGRAGQRARGAFVRHGRRGRSGRSGPSAVSALPEPLRGPGPVMTLEELPGERRAAGRMEQAGDALEEVLSKALSQRSLTLGVYEAAKLLNVDPDNVVLCLLAAEEEEAGDAALQIHFTLLRAFCCENDINILRVSNPARLAELLLPAAGPDPPADLHCVLVTNPQASQWKDPALSQLMCFCRESRYLDQWVPVINLPER